MRSIRFPGARWCRAQGTVEAVLTIPVMFLLLLTLLQPGIILYDRMVMKSAAAEACRLLATKSPGMDGAAEAFVRHRLGCVPPHDCFHVHKGGCTWDIQLAGDEAAGSASVTISTEVRPLPLFDGAATLLGMTNGNGNLVVSVSETAEAQPAWAFGGPAGADPSSWAGAWLQ